MCFFSRPNLKPPTTQAATPNIAAPVENQTPRVTTGSDTADANRSARRRRATNPASSLFQFELQFAPGASTTTRDTPGAAVPGGLE